MNSYKDLFPPCYEWFLETDDGFAVPVDNHDWEKQDPCQRDGKMYQLQKCTRCSHLRHISWKVALIKDSPTCEPFITPRVGYKIEPQNDI